MAVNKGTEEGHGGAPSDPTATAPRLERGERGTGEKAFDIWLRTRLHEIFDQVMTDDIPTEMRDLVRQIERRDQR